MDFKIRLLRFSSLLFIAASFLLSEVNAQTENTLGATFKSAQEVYAKCGGSDYDERRGAAVLVNRISDSAFEVFIAAGSTKTFQPLEEIGELEIFVQPLKNLGEDQKSVILFEIGQSVSVVSKKKSFRKGDREMIYTPKLKLHVEKDASAVRVRLNGLFGAEKVTTLTTNIDGENSASICSMSKYPSKRIN